MHHRSTGTEAPVSPRQHHSYLTFLDAERKHHRYLRDAIQFLMPVLVCVALQAIVYAAFVSREPSVHFGKLGIVVAILSLVPVLTASTLTAFKRNESPVVTAIAMTSVFASFATSFLNALRLPLSFSALLAVFVISAAVMAFSNVRFHRAIRSHVRLLAFEGMETVLSGLRPEIEVISDPAEDVSALDAVLIHPSEHHSQEWSALLARCYVSGVEIMPWTRYLEIRHGRVDVSSFELSNLRYSSSQILYIRLKWFIDVSVIILTLPITLALCALVASYIYLQDGGPVLFVQHRRGFGGKVFRLYKFRTMYKGQASGATGKNDKRIIPGCNFIRRTRLDELPQLLNVLLGQMSIIGPRPASLEVSKVSELREPKYFHRTLVLPGLTGWAQVKVGYAGTTEEEIHKLAYDLYYIKHLSVDLDLRILVSTIKTVGFGTGAR